MLRGHKMGYDTLLRRGTKVAAEPNPPPSSFSPSSRDGMVLF